MKIQKKCMTLGVVALAAATIVFATASPAAALDPANWSFDVTTTGSDVQWDSPTNVDVGLLNYDVDFTTTTLKLQVAGVLWLDLFAGLVDPADFAGAATVPGPLPITILSDALVYAEGSPPSVTNVDIALTIDALGQGHVGLTNVQFGTFQGNQITAFQIAGTMNAMSAVPEPSTLLLWGIGSIATLFTRRRKA